MERFVAVLALVGLLGCGGDSPTGPSNVAIEDLVVGPGAVALRGNTVTVHYVGTLVDGTKFDSSVDRAQPFLFRLGSSQVITGWNEGIPGMRVGGKRRLTIPPTLAYGNQVTGAIPANSTLVFQVELLSIIGK